MPAHAFAVPVMVAVAVLWVSGAGAAPRRYDFDGTISREVLENYLSRSITMLDLLTGVGNPEDNLRMLQNTGAKFAGRTLYLWGGECHLPAKLATARQWVPKVRALDPDLILQAAIFEIVTGDVGQIAVPDWVFTEFGLPPESRSFRYEAMLFPDKRFHNHWAAGQSVPDIRQLETKLWFFYLAAEYIRVGCEGIHFGQEALIGAGDPSYAHWWELLGRVRKFAKTNARRHLVLCDAHTPHGGPRYNGDNLLFDFHAFPLRIEDVPNRPQQGVLRKGYVDSFYGRSAGGVTPSGWTCEHLPYLVEFDNWGSSGKEDTHAGDGWTWGYDEISWFARQPELYRNEWLWYAWNWLKENDTHGFLEMPGSRCLSFPVQSPDGKPISWYFANTRSDAVPNGFCQEETVKAIWNRP